MKVKPKTDREMILDPDEWPQWPVLPMKRIGQTPNCGVIYGDPKGDTVFFVPGANMHALTVKQIDDKGGSIGVDELLAQGWKVD